jgi:hypothetical protein
MYAPGLPSDEMEWREKDTTIADECGDYFPIPIGKTKDD